MEKEAIDRLGHAFDEHKAAAISAILNLFENGAISSKAEKYTLAQDIVDTILTSAIVGYSLLIAQAEEERADS